jgi:hypothetical protein
MKEALLIYLGIGALCWFVVFKKIANNVRHPVVQSLVFLLWPWAVAFILGYAMMALFDRGWSSLSRRR